jgi:hypothetical protein
MMTFSADQRKPSQSPPAPRKKCVTFISIRARILRLPFEIVEEILSGGVAHIELNAEVAKGKSILAGVDEFRANPEKYLAIHYQTNMATQGWPVEVHQFTNICRDGIEGIEVD